MKKSIFSDTYVNNLIFVTLGVFLIEVLFRAISNFELVDYATLRILISSFILSIVITFLSSLTKRKWLRNIINLAFLFVYAIYTWLQLGFINYLGVYISFNTTSQFGAVKDYIFDYLMSFKLVYYAIFLPFVMAILWYLVINRKRKYNKINFNKSYLLLIPILIISIASYYGTITLPFMQNELQIKSNKKLFVNPDVPTVAVNQFGTTVFGILDLKTYLFPMPEEQEEYTAIGKEESEPVIREVTPALEEIAASETNKKYKNLNNYFAAQKVTDYNEYTGMFEGKNVVVILMESVNEAIINKEYFPNFYKLYIEGWHWENNYSPRNSCATGNNEFSAMTGLYSIYNTCTTNVYKNNTYFNAIFSLFNEKGYTTSSMHNFVEWYYYRKTIHPNMGSGTYYGADKLKIKTAGYYGEWPSDVEFFDKALEIVLNDDTDAPWMTWLTTVTSHQPYSSSSTYGDLYKDDFKKLGYSTSVSRYLSKLKVVDEAIGLMIEKLQTAGELDNTVIVMLADHYPYGLSKSQVSEIIDHDLNDYEIEKTPLVIYNTSMTSKAFTEYSSYINLVPTLANLMNLNYDPRLYMGADLLSPDYESKVVFADGSWKDEKAYYNASTSKIKYYGEDVYTSEEIQEINNDISLKIQMSSTAIKNNYFNYLEKKLKEYEEAHKQIEELPVEEGTSDTNKVD
ncbi:MAG: LTA synthase family protein [Firmicutes bacterium]|nr:LTA synthase family protein [Bacillota bacterium]